MRRWGVTAIVLGFLATALPVLPAGPAQAQAVVPAVTVFAHRGGADLAPENTLGAFRKAHADFGHRGLWLELDVQLTADNHLVVLHDETLDRTTTCTGTVRSKTLAQLANCDASKAFPGWPDFEKIPTLREVMREGKTAGWRLLVELKNIPLEANFDLLGSQAAVALGQVVQSVAFPTNRLIVQSFWPLSLDRIEARMPMVSTALLTSSTLPSAPQGVGIPVLLNAVYSTLRGYEIVAPDYRSIDMNPEVVALAQLLGRQVVVWTPNTPSTIATVLAAGVDGVISDRPDLVYAQIG